LSVAQLVVWIASRWAMTEAPTREQEVYRLWAGHALSLGLAIAYFWLLDHVSAGTLGKRLFRLLVCAKERDDPPAAGAALVRAAVFCGLLGAGDLVADAFLLTRAIEDLRYDEWSGLRVRLGWLLPLVWFVAGWLVLFSTVRAASGFRGLHECISGTRVLQLP